jgi:galactokinase
LKKEGYCLCISDTLGSHADLTEDYAAIPYEMKQVAGFFGKDVLRETDEYEFYSNLAKLRQKVPDRAVLRAMHFFSEQRRVLEGVKALREYDFPAFLNVIQKSGDSSSKLLQNIYSTADVGVQNVTIALAVSEHVLQKDRCYGSCESACRVHGGGFAGTIQAFVKQERTQEYKQAMEAVFGKNTCHILQIRPCGVVRLP